MQKKNNFEVTGFGLVNLLIYVLSELLDKEYSQNVIISGDFNVKFGTMDVDTIVLCNLLASYGLSYFNSKPNRGRSCLDNYFLQNWCGRCKCNNSFTSDHSGLILSFQCEKNHNNEGSRILSFTCYIGHSVWYGGSYIALHVKTDLFLETITNAMKLCFPIKSKLRNTVQKKNYQKCGRIFLF